MAKISTTRKIFYLPALLLFFAKRHKDKQSKGLNFFDIKHFIHEEMFLIENTIEILKKEERKKRAFGHTKNIFIKTNKNS